MYERDGLPHSNFVLDDSRGSNLSGLIYLPSRNTTFNSASKLTSEKLTMVFNTLILDDTTRNVDAASMSIPTGAPVTTTTTSATTTPSTLRLDR